LTKIKKNIYLVNNPKSLLDDSAPIYRRWLGYLHTTEYHCYRLSKRYY